jgi:ketosteroid isomerase-like protein
MLKLSNLALFALVVLPMAAIAQTETLAMAQTGTPNEHNAQVAAIEQVMKQYHEAVVTHNGAALSALFLHDANIWLNVLTDSAYDREKAKTPTAQKVRVGNYRDFVKFVSTTTKSLDPEHSNVVIHTDGTIAAVYFDYVFNIDGKAENRGSETWQLVKMADGWRIAAMCYSSDPAALQ